MLSKVGRYELNSGTLTASIASLVADAGLGDVRSVSTAPNPYRSQHNSGVATCVFPDGGRQKFFWKASELHVEDGIGRLGCVGYEADVYRALEPLRPRPSPAFIGSEEDGLHALLVMEYVPAALRLNQTCGPQAMAATAACIGQFQSRMSHWGRPGAIQRYDAAVYAYFAHAAAQATRRQGWLDRVAADFPAMIAALQNDHQTLIHGECYPNNVLVSERGITLADWEWSGVGLGELDLAALIEGWDDDARAKGISAYARARGFLPGDAAFRRRLAAAELFFVLRGLSDSPGRDSEEEIEPDLRRASRLAAMLDIPTTNSRRRA